EPPSTSIGWAEVAVAVTQTTSSPPRARYVTPAALITTTSTPLEPEKDPGALITVVAALPQHFSFAASAGRAANPPMASAPAVAPSSHLRRTFAATPRTAA